MDNTLADIELQSGGLPREGESASQIIIPFGVSTVICARPRRGGLGLMFESGQCLLPWQVEHKFLIGHSFFTGALQRE